MISARLLHLAKQLRYLEMYAGFERAAISRNIRGSIARMYHNENY